MESEWIASRESFRQMRWEQQPRPTILTPAARGVNNITAT
jgi:hypothetical protein